VIVSGDVITGPAQELVDVPSQSAGAYFYQCVVHPTTMTGTLTVK
jgi:plastocyanin